METYISILRGINVAGQKKIKMLELKALYENIGFNSVQTYIQSGNVIFKSLKTEKSILKTKIETIIFDKYGFLVPVQVVDLQEFKNIFQSNPFVNIQNLDISKLYVSFLENTPNIEDIQIISEIQSDVDKFIVDGKVVYVFCPNGYGKTKLNNTFFEKKLKTSATTRNWKTVTKLIELAS